MASGFHRASRPFHQCPADRQHLLLGDQVFLDCEGWEDLVTFGDEADAFLGDPERGRPVMLWPSLLRRRGPGAGHNILGQTYKPVQLSASSFAFDTLFPPGTFVPPHFHPDQDEFIRVLEGEFDL
jgi:hypothetical protein